MINKKVLYFLIFLSIQNVFTESPICISLGSACGPALMLRDLKIRTEAYPFDWIVSPFEALYNTLQDDFKFFLTTLKMRPDKYGVIDFYGFNFTHDWPTIHNPNIDILNADFVENCILHNAWEQALPLVKEKYLRRIERLRNVCSEKNKVIFIRSDFLNKHEQNIPQVINFKQQIINLKNFFKNKYPRLDFILIAISNELSFKNQWNIDHIKNFYSDQWYDPIGLVEILKEVDFKVDNLNNIKKFGTRFDLSCRQCIRLNFNKEISDENI